MKNRIVLLIVTCLGLSGYSQQQMNVLPPKEIVFVSDIKTTHLIFEEHINYLDLGSPYFIADTVKSIVKIKHIGEDIGKPISQKTNLTVITESGVYHSIPLHYNRDTKDLTHRINDPGHEITTIKKEKNELDNAEKEIQRFVRSLQFARSNLNLVSKKEDFEIKVKGIYYQQDYMAIKVSLFNGTTIDLDVDQILFRLKLNKRLASDYIYQERIVKPIRIIDEVKKIKGYNTRTMLMIFKKFTPNENENLVIDVLEDNGGRSSKLTIDRKKLLNPKSIRL